MGYKLLVVDDEPSNLHVLRSILKEDYELYFAKDGEKALEMTHKLHPDLILLDVIMPGINGYEVCKALKNDPVTRDTPVVFVSSLDENQSEIDGLKCGAVEFLHKPVSAPLVKSRVRNILEHNRYASLLAGFQFLSDCIGREAGEQEDKEHLVRLAGLAEILADKYGLSKTRVDDMRLALPLINMGGLLSKPEALSEAEHAMSLLAGSPKGFLQLVAAIIRQESDAGNGNSENHHTSLFADEIALYQLASRIDSALSDKQALSGDDLQLELEALSSSIKDDVSPELLNMIELCKGPIVTYYQSYNQTH
ncbi:hypothetical protein CS022_09340 [Veronia nyctiphanis]|uniref:Response regulatory domain-containing protein n=1 Tax=Veronia nyctiphanis TaxID=1278244 RepID=A0A4Q0YTF7_9GAMM|nr:response regulator [Veronia nyctiphanis]RXJ73444.1 hypothetical protein CS022_09340 [Veronia nyctiphanis]